MRRLSLKQIRTCETAVKLRCRCRCRGLLHGIAREDGWVQNRLPEFVVPPDQAHYKPEEEKAAA